MRRDVQEIFRETPHNKQVMMFSATLSKDIRPVCKKFMQDVIPQSSPTTTTRLLHLLSISGADQSLPSIALFPTRIYHPLNKSLRSLTSPIPHVELLSRVSPGLWAARVAAQERRRSKKRA